MGFEETFRGIAFFATRFTAFMSHAFLFGLVPLLLLVLRPSFAALDGRTWANGRRRLAARLEDLVQSALVASAVATMMGLILQGALIAQGTRGDVDMNTMESIASTSFGQWYLLRFPMLAGLTVLLVRKVKEWSLAGAGDEGRSPSWAWWLGWSVLSLGLLATSSFSGHAFVARPRSLSITNDVVHLASGASWLTGIIVLAVFLPIAWRGQGAVSRLQLLTPVVTRFSIIAAVSISVVAITGVINSLFDVEALNDLVDTTYGVTLTVKIVVFVGVLTLGGVNHFYVRRRLESARGDQGPRVARLFRKTIAIELLLGLLIMGLTGALTGQAKTRDTPLPTPGAASTRGAR